MPDKLIEIFKKAAEIAKEAHPPEPNQILRASDCPPEPVEWLWPDKFPIGKVTLLIGDPGNGKSLIAADIAARVSTAKSWPDHKPATAGSAGARVEQEWESGRQGEGETLLPTSPRISPSPTLPVSHSSTSPSSAIILSAEDEMADTIRPRLDAAGANCDRIFFLPDIKDLRHEFHKLRSALDCVTDCRLLIIDPINAYVGPSDSHFQTITQRIMEPLARLAAEKRIAVVAVAHFRKSEGAAIYRAAGSLGFVSTARAVWTVCRDDSQPGRHLLLPLKCNLAKAVAGLTFTIQSDDVTNAPVIHWSDLPVTTPTADVLAMNAKKRGPEAIELHDASQWLRKVLAQGRRMADEVTKTGTNLGFHERTLRRALHALGGDAQKGEVWEGWWWSIPVNESSPGAAKPPRASAPGSAGGLPSAIATTRSTPGQRSAAAGSAGCFTSDVADRNNASAPGSAGGSTVNCATTTSTPGRAGGCSPQTIGIAGAPHDDRQDTTRSPLLDPRSSPGDPKQPVPFEETCPLPMIFNIPPVETCPLPGVSDVSQEFK